MGFVRGGSKIYGHESINASDINIDAFKYCTVLQVH